MIGTVLQIVLGCFSVAVLAALCAYIALAGRTSKALATINQWDSLSLRLKVLLVGAAIGFLVCMYSGADTLLWWMPQSWGKLDEYGEFQPLRATLAVFFAGIGGMVLLGVLSSASEDRVMRRLYFEEVSGLQRLLEATHPWELKGIRQDFESKHAAACKSAFPGGARDSVSIHSADGQRVSSYLRLIDYAKQLEIKLANSAAQHDAADDASHRS